LISAAKFLDRFISSENYIRVLFENYANLA